MKCIRGADLFCHNIGYQNFRAAAQSNYRNFDSDLAELIYVSRMRLNLACVGPLAHYANTAMRPVQLYLISVNCCTIRLEILATSVDSTAFFSYNVLTIYKCT
jgi:hypothetical protein